MTSTNADATATKPPMVFLDDTDGAPDTITVVVRNRESRELSLGRMPLASVGPVVGHYEDHAIVDWVRDNKGWIWRFAGVLGRPTATLGFDEGVVANRLIYRRDPAA